MKARYDLARKIASFDFFQWLVLAKARGATEVVFGIENVKPDKWTAAEVMHRFDSFILPGVALAGLKASIGSGGEDIAKPNLRDLISFVREGRQIPRLKSVLPPAEERYTVTLRESTRFPIRNSNIADWRAFAAEIGARVIEDDEIKSIHLHERMALYAGAQMNFFVNNGPAILCLLSEYPAMVFDCDLCAATLTKNGIPVGSNYPFALPQQRAIWERGTLENIRRNFAVWQVGQGAQQ